MKRTTKIIILGLMIIVMIGAYVGRGLLPHDQLVQDIAISQVGSYMLLSQSLEELEENLTAGEDLYNRMIFSYGKVQELSALDQIPQETDALISRGTGDLKHHLRVRIDEIKDGVINDEPVLEETGTALELSEAYTPSNELIERIREGEETARVHLQSEEGESQQ
ncbi:hypothetical protein [Alkalicoccus chagannorensis]|uniref:hypothetical protein n=1 Tax=Alkalicoccus chagannorensis TaxID=427072 RepID=UPI0004793C45|nr:hypothetical protein [Alkalicoccus chagannorensis]